MEPNIKEFTKQATKKTGGFVNEFKEFALRGNVVDMAVGIVIGSAFGAVINSIVNDLIMPVVGYMTAGTDFDQLVWELSADATIKYGSFIQTVINFLIIAFSIFIMIKILNKFRRSKEEEQIGPSETEVLIEIRDLLKKDENAN